MEKDIRSLSRYNESTGNTEMFYPATTTDAVVDRTRQKSLADVLGDLEDNSGAYDISAAHNNTTYADLAAALGTNGANVPPDVRKGGMSIRFVQTSDNKYVQYRLMSNTFNTTVTNWQGVDDVPTAGSNNLVKSWGVFSEIENKTSNILFYPNDILYGDIQTISEYASDTILTKDGDTITFSGYKLYTIKNDNTVNKYLYIEATFATVSLGFATIGLYRKSDDKLIGVYQYNGKIVIGIHPNYYVKFNSNLEVKTSYDKKDARDVISNDINTNKNLISEDFICGDVLLSGQISEINDGYVNGILTRNGNIREDFPTYKVYTIKNENKQNKPLYVEAPISDNTSPGFASVCIYEANTDKFLAAYRVNSPNIVKLPVGYYGKFSFTSNSPIKTSYSIISSKTLVTGNPMVYKPTNTMLGTDESEDGYYSWFNEGEFVPFANYKSRKYTVKGDTKYAITAIVDGNPTCLAIAIDSNNSVLAIYNQGTNGVKDIYTDYIINTPPNSAYLLCTSATGKYPIVKTTTLDLISKHYVDKNFESCSEFIVINGTNEEEDGYYNFTGTFKPFYKYKSTKYKAKGNTNYAISATVSGRATFLAIAVDINNSVLAIYNQGFNGIRDNYTDYIISTPTNTAYLLCTSLGNYPIVKQVSYNPASKQYVKEEIEKVNFGDELLSYWKGKKGVWFGTSIPAQGYPTIVGNLLGMSMTNESKGASMARAGRKAHTPNDLLGDVYGVIGLAWQNICYSLTLSQEEKHDIFLNWTTEQRKANLKLKGYSDEDLVDVKGFSELMAGNFYGEETDESQVTSPSSKPTNIMADNYVQFRKNCYADSWNNSTDIEDGFGLIEGRVQPYLSWDNTPDLWIFDHGHNDNISSDSDEDYTTIPEDVYDRWTFLGAMNFLIKKIFDFNPRARIVIIGHYNNSIGYKRIGEAQKVLADYWNIPIYKAWEYLQMPKNRIITTNAYWDKNKVWHESGYDGNNGYDGWRNDSYIEENPRQLEDGTWVHDITLLHAWMADSLHPGSSDAKEYVARNIASFIRNNVL